MRGAARGALTALLLASLAWSALSLRALWQNDALHLLAERPTRQIEAEIDRLMARHGDPALANARLQAHLGADPRNWVAIEAIVAETDRLGISLPPEVNRRLDAARSADSGLMRQAGQCLGCMWEAGGCPLALLLACRAPIELTPVGDLAGVMRAGTAYVGGGEVDQVDLALSALGLAATVAIPATVGGSSLIKLGAGMGKLARRIGAMPPYMARALTEAARDGFDWAGLPGVRGADDLAALTRSGPLAPARRMLAETGTLMQAAGPAAGLHLLGKTGSALELTRLSRVSEAMGPRTLGAVEMLGPARVLRTALRWSDEAVALVLGLMGALAALAGLLGSGLANLALRRARRALRPR